MTDLTRREVNLAAAWSVPVVLAAVAAPAAQGSQPPPEPVCVDPVGLEIRPEPRPNGEGYTRVLGDLLVGNDGPYDTITVPVTVWTSASQEGVRLVGLSGDTLLEVPKDGNKATVDITVALGVDRILRVVSEKKDAEAHVIIGCGARYLLKSVR